MKIGVYGGTFNPIHNAHINLIKSFKEKLNLDKIIVIPTATPPHKQSDRLESASHRFKMCKLALKDMSFCEVSKIEIERAGNSYTIDTLKELQILYPKSKIYLLMGEDMFLTISRWKDSDKIFDLATICCAPRSLNSLKRLSDFGEEINKIYNNFKFEIVDVDFINASSTEIRDGNYDNLPKKVNEYIIKNKLYSKNFIDKNRANDIIKNLLSKKRYLHSLAVANSAVKLAKIYNADIEKCEIAALLHDITKEETYDNQFKIIEKAGLALNEIEMQNKKLWHQKSGMAYIKTVLKIEDIDILNAVRYHTSGRGNMSIIEKIIFVADMISEDRNFDGVQNLRKVADESLDLVIAKSISFVLEDLIQNNKLIIQDCIDAYNDAINHINKLKLKGNI